MKLASVEKIHSISVHPNADTLLKAMVLGWPVVIKKDAGYKDGDLVVFIFPDVIVDKENPHFAFMEKAKWRVWNARFKQEISSGLVMPLSILPPKDYAEGEDLSTALNLSKYEKVLDVKLAGQAKSNFPSHYVSVSDEDNLRSYPRALEEFKGKECYISAKWDGSSATFLRYNEDVHVCSRRLSLKEGDNVFWNLAKKYKVIEQLNELGLNLAIGGECVGQKLNGNKLGLSNTDFVVYRMFDLNNKKELGLDEMQRYCSLLSLKMVPILHRFVFDESWTMEKLTQIADSGVYPNGNPSEGLVLRPTEPVWSPYLSKNLSVKLINQNYKD